MPNSGEKKQGASPSKKTAQSPDDGDFEFGRTKLDKAAFKGDVEEVKKYIAEGADVNCPNALGKYIDLDSN